MKQYLLLILTFTVITSVNSQINPLSSPYYQAGTYTVVMDSIMNASPNDVLIFRPSNSSGGPYATILFQPGANSIGSSYINKHSYDIYWQHLASYGFVIIIINNTSGGPNGTLFTNTHDWIKTNVANSSHWMHNYIDLNRFVVAGHSNGGLNATDAIINRASEIHGIIYMASYPNPGMFGLGAQNVTSYNGKVLMMCGDEDDTSVPLAGSTNDVARTAFNNKFSNVSCKSWIFFHQIGHGGFGDYNNPSQSVGTIGREPATASIRHYLTSFMLSQFCQNPSAFNNLNNPSNQPSTTLEFQNTCQSITYVEDKLASKGINIFPNPATDFIYLEGLEEGSEILVKNISGQTVYTGNISTAKNIDIRSFSSGYYFLTILNKNETVNQMFIKQ